MVIKFNGTAKGRVGDMEAESVEFEVEMTKRELVQLIAADRVGFRLLLKEVLIPMLKQKLLKK